MEARALYKRRGKIGLTDREKRKEDNKLNSKAKRDDLLASRRRMINSKQVPSPPKSMKAKQKDELKQLREWKQARNEAKSRAKEQKRPPFIVGTAAKSCVVQSYMEKQSNIAISAKPKTSFSSKKAISCMSPKPARPTSKILPSKSKENNAVPPVILSDDSTSSSSNAPITDSASNVPTTDTNYDSASSSSNPPTTDTDGNATTSETEGLSDGSSAPPILSPKNRSGRKSAKKKSCSRQRKSSTSSTKVVFNLESELNKADQHEEIDVSYFRKLHSDACNRLTQICELLEGKTAALEQEDDPDIQNKEEVLHQMHTIKCEAQLLMRQKLKQYMRLVCRARSQNGERMITAKDLQKENLPTYESGEKEGTKGNEKKREFIASLKAKELVGSDEEKLDTLHKRLRLKPQAYAKKLLTLGLANKFTCCSCGKFYFSACGFEKHLKNHCDKDKPIPKEYLYLI